MAVPPAYSDLGKSAKDIFSKGFGYGVLKLDVKTKSENGIEFATSGASNIDTGKSGGYLETKTKREDLGLNFSQKWNTENTHISEITIEDQLAKGLKLGLGLSFVPHTGKTSAKLKTSYKRDFVNVGCDLDFDKASPTVHGAAVLAYEGWLVGYQMAFDTAKSKMIQNNFALGYKNEDLKLLTTVNDGTEFNGSIYQTVNSNLEMAVQLAWTAGSNNTQFGIGAKYQLDKDTSLSAKVDNACLVGVGYTQTLRPGVKLTLSGLIDGKKVNAGGHKIGIGFELEA
ncbi:voltage-dependent anion-selective channel protein 3 isoform X2 [Antennarius striatus]